MVQQWPGCWQKPANTGKSYKKRLPSYIPNMPLAVPSKVRQTCGNEHEGEHNTALQNVIWHAIILRWRKSKKPSRRRKSLLLTPYLTLGLLPGESRGRSSLVGCSPWGRKESDTTERLHFSAWKYLYRGPVPERELLLEITIYNRKNYVHGNMNSRLPNICFSYLLVNRLPPLWNLRPLPSP